MGVPSVEIIPKRPQNMEDKRMRGFESVNIPEFSLEDFMKSITFPPGGMTINLARRTLQESGELEGISAPMAEALVLRKTLELLPIGMHDDDILAGYYGLDFSDVRFAKRAKQAELDEYSESVEYKVWSEDEKIVSGRYMLFGIYTPIHATADYQTIIHQGLRYYEERIKVRLTQKIDDYGREYLNAMLQTIDAIRMFVERYSKLFEEKAGECTDIKRKAELQRVADTLRKVPYEPSETLFEAVQALWIIHTVLPISERSWASVSVGPIDRYLLPYYRKWIEDGHTEEEAMVLFSALFKLFDSYGDGACALNLGPEWNELTYLLLKVEKKCKLRAPLITPRMRQDTPDEIYDLLIDETLFGMGQPTFYSEESCRRAMDYRGISEKEDFAINSCMGEIIIEKELADMWGCCINMNIPLELAVNGGKPLLGEFPASLKKYTDKVQVRPPGCMEDIKEMYAEYIDAVMQYTADQNLKRASWIALNRPNPFYSMILDDCIANGRDRAHAAVQALGARAKEFFPDKYDFEEVKKGRGAKYHNVTVLSMGFAHAADALSAIDELVFKQKKYTLDQIMDAARDNYEGNENAQKVFVDLRNCSKYADGSDKADEYTAFILNALADAAEHSYVGNIRYIPTTHTIDANVQFGACVYASMDSRRAGEPFGKNGGAVLLALKNTPTDLMTSAAKMPQYRFSGGFPIDIYVAQNILRTPENRAKFRGLLKSYFRMGGMQVQVNSVNVEVLKKAYENPKEYPNVIVRKGGFSIYFTDLLKEVQKDMIDRFEREAGNS